MLRKRRRPELPVAVQSASGAPAATLPEKDLLERLKLDAETRKIEGEIKTSGGNTQFERYRIGATYLTLVVTLAGALFGGFFQLNAYFDQRAKDLSYHVSKDTNELLKGLTDTANPGLQRLSALQIANFGAVAVPLLVESIDIARQDSVTEAVVAGLRFISEGRGGHEKAVDTVTPLIAATTRVFGRELREQQPSAESMRNHVNALGASVGPQVDATTRVMIRTTLGNLRQQVTTSGAPASDKADVVNTIDTQLAALK